jgi:L-fuconolactonase
VRIDSHQHFWEFSVKDYGWIENSMPGLKRNFLPEDLAPVLTRNGIDGSIAVQARQSPAETEWLLGLAEKSDIIRGVVGWVNLQSDNVDEQLEKYSQNKKLVGVRHVVQDEPDDNFILREKFCQGVSKLERYDLVYDILIFEKHLKQTVQFVAKFPNQIFVLDHIAKPKIKLGELQPWKRHMRELAKFPNVMCKVSGMVTEADWQNWQQEDFVPYLDTIFESFGTDRIMFGSDWPVCTVAASYDNIFGIVEKYIRRLSYSKKEKIFGRNAMTAYNIR